jgi:DNA-directed RNA polymerase specialized sigma24 family protein
LPTRSLTGTDESLSLLFLKLRRLLRSRGRSMDDTDDIIQEAFLRLQLYCQEHVVQKQEAFLVRVALNLCVDQSKREQRARIEPGALERLTLIDPNPLPDAVYDGQKRLRRWIAGINALSPRQREVFLRLRSAWASRSAPLRNMRRKPRSLSPTG